jgi:hypothetical protein
MRTATIQSDTTVLYKNSASNFKKIYASLAHYKGSNHYHPNIPILNAEGVVLVAGGGFSSEFPPSAKKAEIGDVIPARQNFKFGADPEGFVVDSNGRPVAPSMIPGTKEKPHKVPGGAVQRDGMAAEFNVDAANTFREWNANFEKVMKALEGFLPKGHSMSWVPAVEFDEQVFADAPDDYKELGCSPDWNAWEEDLNPPPYCEDRPFLRTASGHIHIGWGENYSLDDALHQRNCFDFVKQLDWYLGGWSLKHDSDPTRRALYGRAGACRLKSYGVEYRVLSNFWITTADRRKAVWNRMQLAVKAMEKKFLPECAPEGYNNQLIEAINTGTMASDLKKACRFPFQTIESHYASF